MYFKQFYLGCLAHASYLIGSEGEAAVVDPQRDVDQYVKEADANGLKIKYVIETHLHADFVSGHRELAARTGAEIIFGAQAGAAFPHRAVHEGDEIKLGKVTLKIMETPGHTPESICVLVLDEQGEAQKILTGDTLFIGDVGRPDLAGGKGYSSAIMAGMMFDSLHQKLLTLPNEVEVYPAHGAGSMCGRNMSKETSSTIGAQRLTNYALKPMSKDEFVRMMTVDLPESPPYFPKDAEINRTGAVALDQLPKPAALSPAEVQAATTRADGERCTVLDVRSAAEFGVAHVPGSINIGLGGQFAIWAGSLIPIDTPLIIVAESEEKAEEAVIRLARVGHEGVQGFLSGGVSAWTDAGFPVQSVPQLSVDELDELIKREPALQILDVRRAPEYEGGHVPNAVHSPLLTLEKNAASLPLDMARPLAVICAGGYRSSAATSLLQPRGFKNLLNVSGGTNAWVAAGYSVATE